MATQQTHSIGSGETLGGIAKTYKTSVDALMKANPYIKDPNLIYAGKSLNVPGATPTVAPEVRSNIAPAQTQPQQTQQQTKDQLESTDDVNNYINAGNDDAGLAATPTDRRAMIKKTAADLEDEFTGGTEAPERISVLDRYKEYQQEMGVQDYQDSLAELKKEQRDTEAILRQRKDLERGKPVAMGVIEGRVSETERQERENLDYIRREQAYVTDQFNSAMGTIKTLMDLEQSDYENATKEYERQFTIKKSMFDMASDIVDQEKTLETEVINNARANGEIVVNTAIKSGKTYNEMDSETQLNLTKWSMESGLGPNFFKDMFDISKDKDILTTIISKDKSTASIMYKDGTTKKVKTGIYDAPAADTAVAENKVMVDKLKTILDSDKTDQEKYLDMLATGANITLIKSVMGADPEKASIEKKQTISNNAITLLTDFKDSEFWSSDADDWDDSYKEVLEQIKEAKDREGRITIGGEVNVYSDSELIELEEELKYYVKKKREDSGFFGKLLNINPTKY